MSLIKWIKSFFQPEKPHTDTTNQAITQENQDNIQENLAAIQELAGAALDHHDSEKTEGASELLLFPMDNDQFGFGLGFQDEEVKILEFYNGFFEDVYVILNPFFKHKTPEFQALYESYPEPALTKKHIIEGAEPISWKEFMQISGFSSYEEVNLALNAWKIPENSDCFNEIPDKLADVELDNQMSNPTRGQPSPFIENDLLRAIKTLGYDKLWIAGLNSFFAKPLYDIDFLIEENKIPEHELANIYTQDHKLMIANHSDSFCTYLCGSKELIEKVLEQTNFEGFYCTPETKLFWSDKELEKLNS